MLWYLKDLETEEVYEIKDGMIFGRTEGTVQFPKCELMSKKHCQIILSDDYVYLIDLGSTNGTWVSSQKCIPMNKTLLIEECFIIFGGKNFQFKKKVVLSTSLIRYHALKRGA